MNTERIMGHPMLCIEEQMALTHSAMMQQGCYVLGRDKSRVFSYHYKLVNTVSKNEFQKVQQIF